MPPGTTLIIISFFLGLSLLVCLLYFDYKYRYLRKELENIAKEKYSMVNACYLLGDLSYKVNLDERIPLSTKKKVLNHIKAIEEMICVDYELEKVMRKTAAKMFGQ